MRLQIRRCGLIFLGFNEKIDALCRFVCFLKKKASKQTNITASQVTVQMQMQLSESRILKILIYSGLRQRLSVLATRPGI